MDCVYQGRNPFFVGPGLGHTAFRGSMKATVEFEKLQLLVKREPMATLPRSVKARYEKRLTILRGILQGEAHAYPLGAILVSIGVLCDRQLNRALHLQTQSASQKLLGEYLIEMGHLSRDQLSHALAIQRSLAHPPQK